MMNKQLLCKETKCFCLQQCDLPNVTDNGVLIKVHYVGVCHTDAHMYTDVIHQALLPKVFGHEVSGTVHAVGSRYTGDLRKEDPVTVYPWGGCLSCSYCEGDLTCLCRDKDGPHAHTYGVWKDGGYQQYMLVEDPWSLVRVPPEVPLQVACQVPCSAISAYNAVHNCKDSLSTAIKVTGVANVLVMGAGGVGLWTIEILKTLYGAKTTVLAADINEVKLQEAKSVGADLTVVLPRKGSAEEVSETIKSHFGGQGADAAIDFVNNTATFERIIHALAINGTSVVLGIPQSPLPPINTSEFIEKNLRVQGVYAGSKAQVDEVFELLCEKKIKGPAVDLVSLKDVEPILNKMLSGTFLSARAVVDMTTER